MISFKIYDIGGVLMYSFAELYDKRCVATYRDLEKTLVDYVDTGSHIVSWAVIDILKATGLTSRELKRLRNLCLAGEKDQALRGQTESAREYALVTEHINVRLKAMV